MQKKLSPFTRRSFLKTGIAAAAGAASLPMTNFAFTPPQTPRWTRYNVMSTPGQQALQTYAKAIQIMLNQPANSPLNWFRNAFVHLLDCPHGNWWFYVWHRGYLGYFEQTIRNLTGDNSFAIPYWDWTTLPEIPQSMFNGVLTPTDQAYAPYTQNLNTFTAFIQPAMQSYWNTLNTSQRAQLNIRGYNTFQAMWNDVTGNGVPGNMAYATTANARYLSRTNPKLDPATTQDCSWEIIKAGLQPIDYYNPTISLSFTSTKTPSHMTPPGAGTQFSVIEGLPHNKVHNCIGGVGPLDPGPYGNMTNFLSPVDPVFYLHHSNIDRLWWMWTNKQQQQGYPILPPQPLLQTLSDELFQFYVNSGGQFVGASKAGEYLSTARFDYTYDQGAGEEVSSASQKRGKTLVRGTVRGNRATLKVASSAVQEHIGAAAATLVSEVTVAHPGPTSDTREFHVLVGAPEGTTDTSPDSPFFAGTVAFFGSMAHGHGAGDVTFAVPLPKATQAFKGLAATNATVDIRIVPAQGRTQRPVVLKRAVIRAL